MGKGAEAIAHYRSAVEINPDHEAARQQLGLTLYQQGQIGPALTQWREVLRREPNLVTVLNLSAWVLATSPDASVRNGAEAVALASRAAELTGQRDPAALDTLAAAYAEAGQFTAAVASAKRAAPTSDIPGQCPTGRNPPQPNPTLPGRQGAARLTVIRAVSPVCMFVAASQRPAG